jgi:SAM-dependent methyltransferase
MGARVIYDYTLNVKGYDVVDNIDRQAHWQNVYATKAEKEVSWFQENPAPSLDLIAASGISTDVEIIDVGGGTSRLVDRLIEKSYRKITILDLSAIALGATKIRLGLLGENVTWIVADVTSWEPSNTYDLWHDRAAFHFLTKPTDRDFYVERLKAALRPGGQAIIATFAWDGPEKCSELPIVRYDPEELASVLGSAFRLIDSLQHEHLSPGGTTQLFQFSRFLKI